MSKYRDGQLVRAYWPDSQRNCPAQILGDGIATETGRVFCVMVATGMHQSSIAAYTEDQLDTLNK